MIGQLSLLFEREGDELVLALPAGMQMRYVVSSSPDGAGGLLVEGTGRVRLAWTGAPLYLHLEDGTVLAPRRLPLEGPLNFRDLGGYEGHDRRRVRWGRLYRADHLGALTPADVRTLTAYGIRRVIDFRSDAERAEHGHLEAPGFIVDRRPIVEQMTNQVTPLERILRGELRAWSGEDMTAMYRVMLDDWAESFAAVLHAAASGADGHGGLVFHCTAGKDRTGLAAALLLAVLGVADEEILDDYELTNRYRSERRLAELRPRFEQAGVDLEPLLAFFVPPRSAMADALVHLEDRYGGVEDYLTGHAGVAPDALARLRASLLQP